MISSYSLFLETIRSEFPDMFAPRKPEDEPQSVPGFTEGIIDPDDDESWRIDGRTDKSIYQDFLKVTKERNFQETENEIIINIHKLGQDFYMTIADPWKWLSRFLKDELKGKYISKGFMNILTDEYYEGYIKGNFLFYDDDTAFVTLRLDWMNDEQWKKIKEDGYCEVLITIDKLKSDANKYNL